MRRELLIKEIIQELSVFKNKIEFLSEINLQDLNVMSEFHINEILNIVYDFKLKNSNENNKNNIAIDLEDTVNGIAVQVTSNNRKTKIQETIDKFFKYSLDEKFSTLLIFILRKKQKNYNGLNLKKDFNFNPTHNIIDFSTIITKLPFLPTVKIKKIRDLLINDRVNNFNNKDVIIYKQKQLVREKITKSLIRKLNDIKEMEIAYYDPSYKFIYDDLIIRSIEDRAYPKFKNPTTNKRGDWYKVFSHNVTEHYLEVQNYYLTDIIINGQGEWNYFDKNSYKEVPKNCELSHIHLVERIPLERIIDIDTSYEDPNILVKFVENKAYSEEVPFIRGYFISETNYGKVKYFELGRRNEKL